MKFNHKSIARSHKLKYILFLNSLKNKIIKVIISIILKNKKF